MKRLAFSLLPILLVGCGSLTTVPTAGQLLDAPTKVVLPGSTVVANASSTLENSVFRVSVKLKTAQEGHQLPTLKVKNVYVVTNGGVWAAANKVSQRPCLNATKRCTIAVTAGPAGGLERGEGAQIVVNVQDDKGRTFMIRDEVARVGKN